jgi:hypothetical protein
MVNSLLQTRTSFDEYRKGCEHLLINKKVLAMRVLKIRETQRKCSTEQTKAVHDHVEKWPMPVSLQCVHGSRERIPKLLKTILILDLNKNLSSFIGDFCKIARRHSNFGAFFLWLNSCFLLVGPFMG